MWEIFKDAVKDLVTDWSKLLRTRSESFVFDFLLAKIFDMAVLVGCILATAIYIACPCVVIAYICDYISDIPLGIVLICVVMFTFMSIPVLAKLIPYINKKLDNRKR
jgi:Mg/Co/Ni transporter MgtE